MPFVRVATYATRNFARFVTDDNYHRRLHFCDALHVAMQVRLYLYSKVFGDVERVVVEDNKIFSETLA